MTTTADILLQDILANPQDDTPRLILADWLEDHGEPERAEFIRVQCAIARICEGNLRGKPESDADRLPLLVAAEGKLWRGVWDEDWLHPVPQVWISESVVRRGFVSRAACTAADWLQHGSQVVRCQPVEKVQLTDRQPDEWPAGSLDLFGSRGPLWGWFVCHYNPPRLHGNEDLYCCWGKYLSGLHVDDALSAPPLGYCFYPTREAALTDLSRACLSWARQEAGLPPLPSPAPLLLDTSP